ncbi:hypothetical protein Taro_001014, partial [Colocasia esculenta]|nr:hypothetical protein [Colocasia esculenta]
RETQKRTARQPGQRNGQTHGQRHHTLTDNAQADYNTDSPTGNNDNSSLQRESSDNQNSTKQLCGEPPPKAPRAILGEPHQIAAQPNDTLQTTRATQREREQRQPKQHEAALRRTSTKSAKSRPGRTSPDRSPTKRHTSNHKGNTTVAQNKHKALLGRTSARSDKGRFWEEPSPECTTQMTKQYRPSERTLQQAELQKQHKSVLGEPPPEPP